MYKYLITLNYEASLKFTLLALSLKMRPVQTCKLNNPLSEHISYTFLFQNVVLQVILNENLHCFMSAMMLFKSVKEKMPKLSSLLLMASYLKRLWQSGLLFPFLPALER